MILPQLGMTRRGDAGRVVDVLQGIRNPVHRAAIPPGLQVRVGLARVIQRTLLCHADEGVQTRIAITDAGQRIARQGFR